MGGRRVLSVVAAAVAVLAGIAGCSSGSTAGSGSTLTMWTFKQTHVKALQDAAATFKSQTGITVNITAYTPDDTYAAKVQSAAATHNVADVLEVHAGGEDFTFGGAGILTDLASNVDTAWRGRFLAGTADTGLVSDAVYQESLNPKSTHKGVKKGQLFSIPFTAGTFGIVFASKSKLAAAGIDPTKPPQTWQDLLSWFQTTKAKDPTAGGVTLGLKSSSTGLDWVLEPLAYGYLGKTNYQALFGKDRTQAWGSANGQQVLSLYNGITPYWAAGTQTLAIDDADRAFARQVHVHRATRTDRAGGEAQPFSRSCIARTPGDPPARPAPASRDPPGPGPSARGHRPRPTISSAADRGRRRATRAAGLAVEQTAIGQDDQVLAIPEPGVQVGANQARTASPSSRWASTSSPPLRQGLSLVGSSRRRGEHGK